MRCTLFPLAFAALASAGLLTPLTDKFNSISASLNNGNRDIVESNRALSVSTDDRTRMESVIGLLNAANIVGTDFWVLAYDTLKTVHSIPKNVTVSSFNKQDLIDLNSAVDAHASSIDNVIASVNNTVAITKANSDLTLADKIALENAYEVVINAAIAGSEPLWDLGTTLGIDSADDVPATHGFIHFFNTWASLVNFKNEVDFA
ncbi:hypothetical protein BDV95DRAFT_663976 [Massariosphaeria phaeospora]|uniref:Hydrophobic surface binding protein A-domain-containing protein n=1 Tax=Massariosphaeria phaeospora TaxID=100035 RepID=A0A7C8MCT6_9PLEO|nr:hypothetical protein BDV95DRAFT_663976 [Massariosphaeria phaeospora]